MKDGGKILHYQLYMHSVASPWVMVNKWDVLPKSTQTHVGLFYGDVLGQHYLYIPTEKGLEHVNLAAFTALTDWSDHRIVDAKHERGFIAIKSFKFSTDTYFQWLFHIDRPKQTLWSQECDSADDLNMTALNTGIAMMLLQETVVLCDGKRVNEIPDTGLNVTLTNVGHKAAYLDGKALYTLTMEKK